jgi:hypothetical protein
MIVVATGHSVRMPHRSASERGATAGAVTDMRNGPESIGDSGPFAVRLAAELYIRF